MRHNRTRKRRAACLAALLTAALLRTAPAAAPAPALYVDGAACPAAVELQRQTAYIPLRAFLGALGWDVTWDARSRSAGAEKDGSTLTVQPDAQRLTLDGTDLRVPLYARGGSLYLPLRTLGTLLGYQVTWSGADNTITLTSPAAQDWDETDLYWLSRIICAEAGGEALEGQIAVGNVVLNRVASGEYPNTVYDVIFDRKDAVQFEPVSNGTVYQTPTALSVQAARLALQGVNTAGESLFFFNPSLSQGTWIVRSRTYYTTIGCHRFYL